MRLPTSPEAELARALTVTTHAYIDELRWTAATTVRIELPVHAAVRVEGVDAWSDRRLDGGDGLEDGFSFVRDARRARVRAGAVVRLTDEQSGATLAWVSADVDAEWWTAVAPGAPGAGDQRFALIRMHGAAGRLRAVWDWSHALREVTMDDERVRIIESAGAVFEYLWESDGVHITHRHGTSDREVVLSGFRETEPGDDSATVPDLETTVHHLPLVRDLAEREYRMSEHDWASAGAPRALVAVNVSEAELEIRVDVRKSPLYFRDADAPDPALDNEAPDINSDGVQLHLWCEGWAEPAAWLAIPERDFSRTRVRRISGTSDAPPPAVVARETAGGYEMRFTLPRAELCPIVSLDVLVNDMSPERQRRRGQLVLTGAHGDRVYLRGDRQPRERFLRIRLSP